MSDNMLHVGNYSVRLLSHDFAKHGVHGHLTTANGFVLSIVGSPDVNDQLYGNGSTTFEVMVIDSKGNTVPRTMLDGCTYDDVYSRITTDEIAELVTLIESRFPTPKN